MRARTPLTEETVAERAGIDADTPQGDAAVRLLALQRHQSAEHARLLRELAPLWVAPEDGESAPDDREEADLVVAVALRTTTVRAGTLLRDAHLAVDELPRLFARLEAGDLPVEWHQRILRSVRELTPAQRFELDTRVAAWDLASIPVQRFRRELRLLIAWLHQAGQNAPRPEDLRDVALEGSPVDDGTATLRITGPVLLIAWLHQAGQNAPRPEDLRDVALEGSPVDDGTATLRITGPVPEILSLARRLDASARVVQDQQRRALADGAPIPFDPDGAAALNGAPLTLAALRYAILTGSVLETGGIEVPTERYRLNVTVPVMTLMGLSDAPGVVDGTVPVPAPMARMIAAQEPFWYRVLTDPVTGSFIPAAASSYRPPAAMLEHLRMENPVCAVPGCTRPSTSRAEADHIQEYDHTDPTRGGPTCVSNLHLLCFTHHRLKTRGMIDPVRGPDGTTRWNIGTERDSRSRSPGSHRPRATASIPANRDLATPTLASALLDAWEQHHWEQEIKALMRNGASRSPGSHRPRATASIPANRDLATPTLASALLDAWEQHHWEQEIKALMRNGAFDEPDQLDHEDYLRRTAPPPF
ncbi:HNH endonuclease [Brachybacterium muris UCD-AY4]|uniref:HNH endonuclease n=1 Tax=Brachybacterium muris UCD-AY4 TaxID=1249481 RepID=A0A022KWG2_9MICO|nr:HNH endonuclease [Brachybacterium muris UCD-AY4]